MDSQIETVEHSAEHEAHPIEEQDAKEIKTYEPISKSVEDSEGIKRNVHTFTTKDGHSVDLVFYSPGELPFSEEVLSQKDGYVLGDTPTWRTEKDWNLFLDAVKNASESKVPPQTSNFQQLKESVNRDKAVFFVETGLTHLIDTATVLGVSDKQLSGIRQAAQNRQIEEEGNQIIDGIIAANLYDTNGNIKRELDYEGEVLTLCAWMGDETAIEELIKRKVMMIEEEEKVKEERIKSQLTEKMYLKSVEPLDVNELVAVHLTKYPPRREGDSWKLLSTYDASQWRDARQTVHFALNHAVRSHGEGSWNDTPYAVIAPLNSMIEQNGPPFNLNTVDTYYELSPGSALTLPEGTWVVKPGGVSEGNLFEERDGNTIHVKSVDLNSEDVVQLSTLLSAQQRDELNNTILDVLSSPDKYGVDDYFDRVQERDYAVLTADEYTRLKNALRETNSNQDQEIDALALIREFGTEGAVEQVFQNVNIDISKARQISRLVNKEIQAILKNSVLRLAVDKKITDLGYQVQKGGMWSWEDSQEVTDRTLRLGNQLGVNVDAHFGSPAALLERKALIGGVLEGALEPRLKSGEISAKKHREEWEKYKLIAAEELSRANKRLLYTLGVL